MQVSQGESESQAKSKNIMFLYEPYYEIWIMQFILVSRLKPDLYKSSRKLLEDFVCSSSRQVFISKALFCLYYVGYILMTLFYIFSFI